MFEELVISTKLTPPHPRRHTLHRSRVVARLSEALEHRLTIVHAGAGYGKSTALAALAEQENALCWYSIASEDTDPFIFFLHLVHACRPALTHTSDAPLAALERQSDQLSAGVWKTILHVLINALADVLERPTLLVLDDYHLVSDVPQIANMVNRLIGYAPGHLHVILSGRHPPSLPSLIAWRVRGELLEIDHKDLAFTAGEAEDLFHDHYGCDLGPTEIAALMAETEGWAIALQLVWQGLRSGAIGDLTARPTSLAQRPALDGFFAYLAQEVLNKHRPDVRSFLQTTSVLREMTPASCDALREARDSAAMLAFLHERDLFLVDLGDGQSRYHRLFHDFLRHQLSPDQARELHKRAAIYYQTVRDEPAAIHHLLAASAHEEAAALVDEMGERMVRQGRLNTLSNWIARLPPKVLEGHPGLLTCLGHIARLRSHFDEALGWYTQAETQYRIRGDRMGASRTLQGQALVYLDTVRPAQAESLLAEALRLSEGQQDREDRARLLELLAENKLNLGHPKEAERLRAEAHQWREEGPSEGQLSVRVMVRTGQIDRARAVLTAQAGTEGGVKELQELGRAHRSHREVQLLLALIYAFQGQSEAAFDAAQSGIAIGQQLGSPFVTAVGYMRLGHAWLIRSQRDAHLRAIECYRQAIALGDAVAVRRTRVEAQWGLCRAFGFHGDLASAQEAAALGVEIGSMAGDPWIVALIELTLGAGYVLAGRQREAIDILRRVVTAFRDCSDNYGRTAAHLWLGLAYLQFRQREHLAETVDELLRLTETHGYEHLFIRRALLGPPDNRILVPLLLEARRRRRRPGTAARLLNDMGLSDVEFHPGYQLRVQTLGPFRAWRGSEEIDAREWRRIKARQLFQLLLTRRGRAMQREEIVDILWPDLDSDAVQRDFKVALNALNKALEPARPPGTEPAYIVRHGTTYGLRPEADVWLDVDEFERLIDLGDRYRGDPDACGEAYQQALDLYHGEYLKEALYEDWASEERERFLALYLRTLEKLAVVRLDQEHLDAVIRLCQRILALDDCWERAYRLMMVAFAHQGNRPQALRVYQACEETLQQELGAQPELATRHLHKQISSDTPCHEWVV